MVSFLGLLPRTLTTFLFALAALLRFYGTTDTEFLHLTTLRWSLLAFSLGSAALVANLGLEWNAGRQSRNREAEERERAARRARIQNRWIVLQVQHQIALGEDARAALADFVAFLQDYGE